MEITIKNIKEKMAAAHYPNYNYFKKWLDEIGAEFTESE